MKRLNSITTAVVLLTYFTSVGQGKLSSDRFLTRITNNQLLEGTKKYDAEGSPYLQDDFIMGEIFANDGKAPRIMLRYNIYEDHMEFQQGETFYALKPEKSVDKVRLGVQVFVVEEYPYKGKSKVGYLQRLDSGKVILLAKKGIDLSEAQQPSAMKYTITPAKFSRTADIYYYRIGNEIMKVESVKKIIASLPDHQEEVSKFVKENSVSVKDEGELTKLFKFYNSL